MKVIICIPGGLGQSRGFMAVSIRLTVLQVNSSFICKNHVEINNKLNNFAVKQHAGTVLGHIMAGS